MRVLGYCDFEAGCRAGRVLLVILTTKSLPDRDRRTQATGPFSGPTIPTGCRQIDTINNCCLLVYLIGHRADKLIFLMTQIATAATRPALANTPETIIALKRITPNAYATRSSAHRITPMKRLNNQ